MAADGDGLAAFVAGLPGGERHKGFFWAASTAAEDALPEAEVAKVAKAGIDAGLDPAYVHRTLAEVHDKAERDHGKADPHQEEAETQGATQADRPRF